MAYTNVWSDTSPTGSEAANTLDDIIRSVKVDIEQRFIDIFAMPNFTADPLRPYGLKFTDAQDSIISLGNNAGVPRNLVIKNKAGTSTYFTFGANNTSTVALTCSSSLLVAGTAALQAVTATTINATGLITGTLGVAISGASSSFTGITSTTGTFSSTLGVSGTSSFGNTLTITSGGFSLLAGGASITGNLTMTSGSFITSPDNLLLNSGSTWAVHLRVNSVTYLTVAAASITASTGIVVNAGGITVSSGTTAVQAVTATNVFISGVLTLSTSTTGSTAGDIVILQGGWLRAQNTIGGTPYRVIRQNAATGAVELDGDGWGVKTLFGLTVANTLTISAGGASVTGNLTMVSGWSITSPDNLLLNAASGWAISMRVNGTPYLTVAAAAITLATGLTISTGTIIFPLGSGTGVVSVGAVDSGGVGFKLLRVPN